MAVQRHRQSGGNRAFDDAVEVSCLHRCGDDPDRHPQHFEYLPVAANGMDSLHGDGLYNATTVPFELVGDRWSTTSATATQGTKGTKNTKATKNIQFSW